MDCRPPGTVTYNPTTGKFVDNNKRDILIGGKGKDKFIIGADDIVIDADGTDDSLYIVAPTYAGQANSDGILHISGGFWSPLESLKGSTNYTSFYLSPLDPGFDPSRDSIKLIHAYEPIARDPWDKNLSYLMMQEGLVIKYGNNKFYVHNENFSPYRQGAFGIKFAAVDFVDKSPFFHVGEPGDNWQQSILDQIKVNGERNIFLDPSEQTETKRKQKWSEFTNWMKNVVYPLTNPLRKTLVSVGGFTGKIGEPILPYEGAVTSVAASRTPIMVSSSTGLNSGGIVAEPFNGAIPIDSDLMIIAG